MRLLHFSSPGTGQRRLATSSVSTAITSKILILCRKILVETWNKRVAVTYNSRPIRRKTGMKHIIQQLSSGPAYQFKMRTPTALRGMIDPATGKASGTYIQ